MNLLDYTTSPLNPALKFLVFLLFIVVVIIYLDTRRKIGGDIHRFIDYLFFFSLCMTLGSLFRYFGHGTDFGFSSDYSLKWFQSIAYLCGTICLIFAGKILYNLFRRDHE